jgi:hypothetical protein
MRGAPLATPPLQISREQKQGAILGLVMMPALTAATFTRRRFGYRAINPFTYIIIAGVLWIWHDYITPFFTGVAERPFLAGPGVILCGLMLALGLYHWFEALAAHRRGDNRHTHFLGEPWLAAFIPWYWLAVTLDILLIAFLGFVCIAFVDGAFGSWLVIGVAARNDARPDAQSRPISDAH